MRTLKYTALLTTLTFMLSMGAFAKDHDSGSFNLDQTAQVGSTTLQPGNYKAEWSGTSDDLHIAIVRDGKTVATTQGQMKELPAKADNNAVTIQTLPDNTKRVVEIDFNHKTEALVFSGM